MVRTTKGIHRVLVVALLAVGAFAVAISSLGDDARRGCVANAPIDPTYEARLIGPIETAKTQQEIAITHEGQPVRGAKVCARVAMVGMEAMGVSDAKGTESAPGVYKMTIVFPMGGGWSGNLLITERGKPMISLPFAFEVAT